MSQSKNPQINATVDFAKGRGFGTMTLGLPRNFLTGDPLHVCATIAALFLHPEPVQHQHQSLDGTCDRSKVRVTLDSQAVGYLALYAGGVAVTLDKKQFRKLERRVRHYMSLMRAPHFEHTGNLEVATFVLDRAITRARTEMVI